MQNESQPDVQFVTVNDIQIAVRYRTGTNLPGLVWLGGYKSDMLGSKAQVLDHYAADHNLACLRFDYSGHGESGGEFLQGNISTWLAQSLEIYKQFAKGPQILVGSSMGGWIALRMAQELQKMDIKPQALILLAPAPDFTHDLVEPALTNEQKQALETQGYFEIASDVEGYDPMPYSRTLIEDGRHNLVLNAMIDPGCPVYIIQGMQDDSVPYKHALKLVEHLPVQDVNLTLVRDGEHRLSRPQDLDLIINMLNHAINQSH